MRTHRLSLAVVVAAALLPASRDARAEPAPIIAPLRAAVSHAEMLDRLMASIALESADAAVAIRTAYRDHLDLLALGARADLETALASGGLAYLPADSRRFNLAPRLEGPHPIGEKDLANQHVYLAARPAAIGALLDLAARVRSGPIEITSLVRHGGYQEALRATNANASTAVPVHTMGLAFDIALINTPPHTVLEILDVLRRMRDRGDILFIGERRQFVFHVVPHPSRLGHFDELYTRAFGAAPATQSAVVVAPALDGGTTTGAGRPAVVTEIVAVSPLEAPARPAGASAGQAAIGSAPAPTAAAGLTTVAGFGARLLAPFLAALALVALRISRTAPSAP